MINLDIYSGFLGAGKTTLIKKMISEGYQNEKIVLIENEFGEISVDGGFLKDAGVEINEMNSGCICCSLVGDFKTALKKVIEETNPDRILIEPSGVGKLSDVIAAVNGIDQVFANHSITVVDAKKCKLYMKNFGEFFNNQIENASTIVLSRTQELTEEKINEVIALIQTKNQDARILTTPWDALDGSTILQAMEASHHSIADELLDDHDHECCCHEHHHHECSCQEHEHEHHHHHDHECSCHNHDHDHHHADDVFSTWGTQTSHTFSEAELKEKLKGLMSDASYGTILRAKGIVSGEDAWYYFDMVPEEMEIRLGNADYTGRIVVIGTELNEAKLKQLFIGE